MTVMIVEDERDVRESLAKFLQSNGLTVVSVPNGAAAIARLASAQIDIIVTDIRMPEVSGIELLCHVRSHYPAIPVIIITAFGSIEDAVSTIRMGASDYVVKPLVFEDMLQKISRVAEGVGIGKAEKLVESPDILGTIVGNSAVIRDLKSRIERVADSGTSVVIHGASGTGKELVARALHGLSSRKEYPFIAVNCAAIPENLLESQFFGYAKGAFTGASADRKGLIASAEHGTIFLDEVTELSLGLQAKLLRVVEDREVTPVGSSESTKVNLAIISASATKLRAAVHRGSFREDLFFRLNVIEMYVPPLKDRADDIPELANYFLRRMAHRFTSKMSGFSRDVMSAFMRYEWPGNVRELRNVVERSVVLSGGPEVQLVDLPPEIADFVPEDQASTSYKDTMRSHERELILKALQAAGNDKKTAARILGMGLSTLYRKLEEFGLE